MKICKRNQFPQYSGDPVKARPSIIILYHKFSGSSIGEYPISPVIGTLTASCFAPKIAGTRCFFAVVEFTWEIVSL